MASPNSWIVARRLLLSCPPYNSPSSSSAYLFLSHNSESNLGSNPRTGILAIVLLFLMAFLLILSVYFHLHRFNTLLFTPYNFPTGGDLTITTTTMSYNFPYSNFSPPPPPPPPPHGLHCSFLENLPKVAFRSSPLLSSPDDQEKEKNQRESCVICLDDFRNEESLLRLPCCAHLFHPRCIKTWFTNHTTCPLCRHCLTTLFHSLPHQPSILPLPIMELVPSVDPSNVLQGELCRMESRWHSMDHPQLLMSRGRLDIQHSYPVFDSNSICNIPSSSSSGGDEKFCPQIKDMIGCARYLKRSSSDSSMKTRKNGDGDGEGSSSSSIKKRSLTKFASEKYGSSWACRSE